MSGDPRFATPVDRDALIQHYTEKARSRGVPEHLIEGLVLYIVQGLRPGHFLQAVVSNDLFEAFSRADVESRNGLFSLVSFLYNDAPAQSVGSPQRVREWIETRGMVGGQP